VSHPADVDDTGPVEISDSRIFYASRGVLTWSLAVLSVAWWGLPVGLVVFGTHALWSFWRLFSRRVPLRITKEGVVAAIAFINTWGGSPGQITHRLLEEAPNF